MTALIRKQVVAVIDDRTTMVCLHAAGMITEVDQPFETLAGDFMEPPFHIHCRSIMRPWMSGFLSKTRAEANEEMQRRPKSQRRLGPDGEIGSRVPPPYDWNRPVDYTFPGSRDASYYPAENGVEFATGRGLETNVPKPDPRVKEWKALSSRISQDVLKAIVSKMEELLFSQDEADSVWAQLLDWVKEHVVKTVADLPAALKRLLGL